MKANEERGQVARETFDYAFTDTSAMSKTEWLVDSGASSHMTSVRDKFVPMKELNTPVCITIADGRKIDAVAMGTVGLRPMDRTSVTLSEVFWPMCAGCCMGKMREDNFPRNPENTVKSAGVLDLIHSDVMGPMQTKTPGGCTIKEVLEKFKMFKDEMENATGRKIKRIRSDNGRVYTGRRFKEYLSKQGIRHEQTAPYTPQKNALAERMNWGLVEIPRCMLYHEGIGKNGGLKQSTHRRGSSTGFPIP
ncbi:unnamed protein product [Phytophthora fragariaefolia]|uniref:Unnamed protein product n=1 Tax=Phytophthora fragariaefolia TaxID=1490495 RepID=A0A9W6Y0S5_9STRA|nr:unnamed protein product [Phytophthora fragariaefolia]